MTCPRKKSEDIITIKGQYFVNNLEYVKMHIIIIIIKKKDYYLEYTHNKTALN